MELWARCVRGLEPVVVAEARRAIGATVVETLHRSVVFTTASPGRATELRTADDVYILAGLIDGVARDRASLQRIESAVDALPVAATVAARQSLLGPTDRARAVEVTASFLGRRNYNRFEIEDAAGRALARTLALPYVSRSKGATPPAGGLAWRVHVEGDRGHVGLRIGAVPLHRRAYKVAAPPGTLHPPVAAAFAVIAGVPAGKVVLDPTCGAATIVIESAIADRVAPIGCDYDRAMLAAAAANVARAGVDVALVHADAARIPITGNSIDRVFANLPWGGQAPPAGGLAAGGSFWAEAARVVAPGGVVAVLTGEDRANDGMRVGLTPRTATPLSLMGAHPVLVVYDA